MCGGLSDNSVLCGRLVQVEQATKRVLESPNSDMGITISKSIS